MPLSYGFVNLISVKLLPGFAKRKKKETSDFSCGTGIDAIDSEPIFWIYLPGWDWIMTWNSGYFLQFIWRKKKTLNSGKKKSILQTELAYFTEGDIFPFLVNKHRKKTISLYLLRGINISPLCFNATIIRELTHSSVLMLKHIQYICHAINPP